MHIFGYDSWLSVPFTFGQPDHLWSMSLVQGGGLRLGAGWLGCDATIDGILRSKMDTF